MNDNVNHPKHYCQGKHETIDFLESLFLSPECHAANVIKYVSRYKNKNGVEDLKKAMFYLNRLMVPNNIRLGSITPSEYCIDWGMSKEQTDVITNVCLRLNPDEDGDYALEKAKQALQTLIDKESAGV